MEKIVFLDKDGTLIEDEPYNIDPAGITFCEGVPEALRLLQDAGYKLAVVTNQAGVAHGLFTEEALLRLKDGLRELLLAEGVRLDAFYYCPHHIHGRISRYAFNCTCRKPMPGMLVHGAAEHKARLAASWMIGDILDDVEAGNRAGCRTILIDNGNETEWRCDGPRRKPHFLAGNMLEAVRLILGPEEHAKLYKNGGYYERQVQSRY